MANDFKNYMKNNRRRVSESDLKKVKETFSDRDIESVEEFARQHEGMSEAQMMREISDLAARGRQDGSISDSDIEAFRRNVMPMLDAEQKRKLEGILSMMRRQ